MHKVDSFGNPFVIQFDDTVPRRVEAGVQIVGPLGATGPEGPEGPEGPAGQDGADGTNGTDGADGAAGAQGPAGPPAATAAAVAMGDDFFGATGSTPAFNLGWARGSSGAGISLATSIPGAESGRAGVVAVQTGTTNAGWCGYHLGAAAILAVDTIETEWIVQVPALSDGDETFAAWWGLSSGVGQSGLGEGVAVYYDHTVSANWLLRTVRGGVTNHDTGVLVAAGQWERFRLVTSPAGVTLYHATSPGGVESEVASGLAGELTGVPVSPAWQIFKTVGTTDRQVRTDFFRLSITYTAPR